MACVMVGAPHTYDVFEEAPPELATVIRLGTLIQCRMSLRVPNSCEELSNAKAGDYLWLRIFSATDMLLRRNSRGLELSVKRLGHGSQEQRAHSIAHSFHVST